MGEGTPKFLIRPAQEGDIPAVLEIAAENGLSFWPSKSYTMELGNPDALFLCVEDGAAVKGFAIGQFIRGAGNGGELELYNIGISIKRQRRGMGRALLQCLAQEAKGSGCSAIWLEVRESNLTGVRFYESFGFAKVYERPSFYSNPTENALVLRLELK